MTNNLSREKKWTVHLLRRHPWRFLVLLPVIFFALVFLHSLAAGWFITLLALAIFFFAIAEFLLPIHYQIDDEGVHSRLFGSHRLLPWVSIRRIYCYKNSLLLSTMAKRTRLESYRGLLLRCVDSPEMLQILQGWFAAKALSPEIIEE